MNELQVQVEGLNESTASSIQASFTPMFEKANEWKKKAELIKVESIEQVDEMQKAREARLALKNIRCDAENERKRLKEESLRTGKAIDGMANVIKFLIIPIEEYLQKQEDFIEVQNEKEKVVIQEKRIKELEEYDIESAYYNLKDMSAEDYKNLLATSIENYNLKKQVQEKTERERIEKEKQELEERKKIAVENEKLKQEVEKREKDIEEERKKNAAIAKELEEKENTLKKTKEAAEAKVKAEEEIRTKIKVRAAEIEKKKRDDERDAQLAPDKKKLELFAKDLMNIELPELKSDESKEILRYSLDILTKLTNYIKEKTINL